MLIEPRSRMLGALLLLVAFQLGAAKSCAICVGLLGRRFLCRAFPESIEIDDIAHARLLQAKAAEKERQRRSNAESIAIQNPQCAQI